MTVTTHADPATQPLPEGIIQELAEFEEHIKEFRRGEIGEVKMQKIRLQFGTYAQRQDGVQMVRIKIPGAGRTPRTAAGSFAFSLRRSRRGGTP